MIVIKEALIIIWKVMSSGNVKILSFVTLNETKFIEIHLEITERLKRRRHVASNPEWLNSSRLSRLVKDAKICRIGSSA